MSAEPVTIQGDTFRITSTSEKAEDMIAALTPADPKARAPRQVNVDGSDLETEPDETSKAASLLGKKGGQAAAEARALAAKARAKEEKEQAKDKPKDATEPVVAKGKNTEPEEDEEEDSETVAAKPLGKPRDDLKARLGQLAEKRREAEDRATRAEQQLAQERRQRATPAVEERKPEPVKASPDEDPEPELAKFKDYESYVKAVGAHSARAVIREERAKQVEHDKDESARRELSTTLDAFKDRIDARQAEDETFKERTGAPQELFEGKSIAQVLRPSFLLPRDANGKFVGLEGMHVVADRVLASEVAPQLMEHWAAHPQELQRIAALQTPGEIALAVARLEGRLEASGEDRSEAVIADTSSRRAVSKAGTPVRSVAGSPHTDTGELGDDAPLSAFVQRFGQREQRSASR